jgi:hypothetical protein
LGSEQDGDTEFGDLSEQLRVAEMIGELLAAGPHLPALFGIDVFRQNVACLVRAAGGMLRFRATFHNRHVRGWIRRAEMPRIDSLVALSLNQSVPLVRLLTEPIPVGNTTDDPRSRYVHHRVSDSVVVDTLSRWRFRP